MNTHAIFEALAGKGDPHDFMARCPAHDDKNPSLHVTDRDGDVLFYCFGGCRQDAVIAALKARGLWQANGHAARPKATESESIAPAPWKRPIAAKFEYRDESGAVLFQSVKFADGLEPRFMQRKPGGQYGWEWSLKGVRRIPYRLPELFEAALADQVVVITEGEKDADTVRALGLAATCNPNGAGNLPPRFAEFFRNLDVIVTGDHDAAGREHVAKLGAALSGVARRVRVLDISEHWPSCPPKGDVSDWVAAGCTADELKTLLWNLPDFRPIEPDRLDTQNQERAADLSGGGANPDAAKPGENGPDARQDRLEVLCMAGVDPQPVEWLWPDWVALGKVSVLAGDGGEGKSTVLCDLAARTSSGENWPDGAENGRKRRVLILAAEDAVADTLAPRLIAAGADTQLVYNIRSVQSGTGRRSFNLQADLSLLEGVLDAHDDIALIIIDPITSYLGKVDSHKNAEVRSVLEPLGEMATRRHVAVVCNNHFTKNSAGGANSRVLGSVAFVNQARAAFIVTPDAEDRDRKLLMPSKMNLAPIKHGLAYRIGGRLITNRAGVEILTSEILWETAPVTISADAALAAHTETQEARVAGVEAEEFLRDKLSAGPVPAKEGEEHARALGIAPRTLARARKRLAVIAEKDGMKGPWLWRLPAEDCQTHPKNATSQVGHSSEELGSLQGTVRRQPRTDRH
jgi:hypothetical protein